MNSLLLLKNSGLKRITPVIAGVVLLIGILIYLYYSLPKPQLLENFTFSSVVYDKEGKLLRLTLSRDEKYRLFIGLDDIPSNVQRALLLYEDKNFYHHFGIDLSALIRSSFSMLTGGRKQGGSTVTMQLARLLYHIDSSTIHGKITQIFRSIQLERHYSKRQILEAYFNMAPYGDNIEGIAAAALIYFKVLPQKLTLPEILALIGIPQNPVKRNPVKYFNHMIAAQKRLAQAWQKKYPHDPNNIYLSLPITISDKKSLPFHAPHFTTRQLKKYSGTIKTTLDLNVQLHIEEIVDSYVKRHKNMGFDNAVVFVIDHTTMQTSAYIGSADFFNDSISGQVDGITALRSPGSAMKPFIYAMALDEGLIHPKTMLKDLPRKFIAYNPENFGNAYRGVTSATTALIDSLNIPAVDLLNRISTGRFYNFLVKIGIPLKSEAHYGLAMALGGYEMSLYDMVKAYAVLANKGRLYNIKENHFETTLTSEQLLSPESSFLTLDMLSKNKSIDGQHGLLYWKTGTSYSYKDAWTVGISGKYTVGVWVGNFDGMPNHAFIGRTAAAPLFFEIVRYLESQYNTSNYVPSPSGLNLSKINICEQTGDIANEYCSKTVQGWFIPGVSPIRLSNIHRQIPIDIATGLRACRHTPPTTQLKVFEFWPSDILKAFEQGGMPKNKPPKFKEKCKQTLAVSGSPPEIIYPTKEVDYVLRSHRLTDEKIVLQAAADSDVETIFWFFDDALVGQTKPNEPLEVKAKTGSSNIKAIDDKGRISIQKMTITLVD